MRRIELQRWTLLLVISVVVLLVVCFLWLWSIAPTHVFWPVAIPSVAIFLWPHVEFVSRIREEKNVSRQFTIKTLILLTAASGLLFSLGLFVDVIILMMFILYSYLIGPGFVRIANRQCQSKANTSYAAAAMIGASLAFLTTLLATAAYLVGKSYFGFLVDKHFGYVLSIHFVPSVLFAWLFILGDNGTEFQHALYGLPFAVVFNSLAGALVGYLFGVAGVVLRRIRS